MRATQASKTAGWVAAARAFGRYLPGDCQLADDPYGIRFSEPWLRQLARAFEARPGLGRRAIMRGPGTDMVLYMQLRTRFIDDALRDFAARGGSQVVLLGAGYDCRSLRLRQELPGLRFFEVDHPATQAVKRETLPELAGAGVRFVTWDFQHQPMADLPDALRAEGHDPSAPTLTIWEGVTMYLTLPAIEATVAAVRAYSAASSPLVFTYFDRRLYLDHPSLRERAVRSLVHLVGEPFRFGWSPEQLPAWLEQHGFTLQRDIDARGLAEQLLPREHHRRIRADGRHYAIARVHLFGP